jgi:tryptophanyl-tRNA synthetase
MSLQQPHLKMSKSHSDPRSRIILTDKPEEISRKIMAARTDSQNSVSYDPVSRPGVSNLLELLSYFDNQSRSPESLGEAYADLNLRDFKALVADAISNALAGIGQRFEEVIKADGGRYLDDIEANGAEKARANAEETMAAVRTAIGF